MKHLFVLTLLLFPIWAFSQKSISSSEAAQLIHDTNELLIIDVRTPIEYDSTAIQNAMNIDVKSNNFQENIQKIDKTKPILVYCRSGRRSLMAMNTMQQLGFAEVYNLLGGIIAFKKEFPDLVISKK
ncbi:MAG: rhodanese-like domain-containing protein [Bacteroidales bacterium]|nr:rhodanese-like domain-containing protein [Bacteroidales bacterium]MBR5435036.1 rhodanese-like domain-containing protein [Bacteroidales bacterium]